MVAAVVFHAMAIRGFLPFFFLRDAKRPCFAICLLALVAAAPPFVGGILAAVFYFSFDSFPTGS